MSNPTPWTFGSSSVFYTFAREERQLCALLAHLLMQQGPNVERFLNLFEEQLKKEDLKPYAGPSRVPVAEAEVYLEFAFLRDRWNQLGADLQHDLAAKNNAKREFLFELLGRVPTLRGLEEREKFPADAASFNVCFMGTAPRSVKHDIASPALWTVAALYKLSHLDQGVTADRQAVFRDLCKFKWAFRIKPDLVLVIPGHPPICVEGKLESPEGSYPTKPDETKLFDKTFTTASRRVWQVELQDFLFRVLLGCEPRPLFIAQKEGKVTIPGANGTTINVPQLRWDRVFKKLDHAGSIPFVHKFISQNRLINERRLGIPGSGQAKLNGSSLSTRPNSPRNYDGTLKMPKLLEDCRRRGDEIEIGFMNGELALRVATDHHLQNRMWRWRDHATNRGKIQASNWLRGRRFLALMVERGIAA
jgi:hypothetical protein